jgi:hypothetical protein
MKSDPVHIVLGTHLPVTYKRLILGSIIQTEQCNNTSNWNNTHLKLQDIVTTHEMYVLKSTM